MIFHEEKEIVEMISTDEEAGCGLAGYLQRYEQQSTHLLNYRGSLGGDHPHGHSYFRPEAVFGPQEVRR